MDKYDEKKKLSGPMKFFMILLFIVIIGAVIYFTVIRYNYIGQSVAKGDFKTTALLFSPELAASVANILYRR
uniref:Transmembrane protein n=1 Tax=Mimivirus LCMiAC01 TaxID=2506608 RepID=A0A481Z188_9VIRU|nr:MAG: hypothetical protein LCMiAC01_02110 [Mimivirus LCMiAC01]